MISIFEFYTRSRLPTHPDLFYVTPCNITFSESVLKWSHVIGLEHDSTFVVPKQ
jgi:hypothetical protein